MYIATVEFGVRNFIDVPNKLFFLIFYVQMLKVITFNNLFSKWELINLKFAVFNSETFCSK
jgi:hypothetical protein